jgi:hypothetical protein
MPFWHFGIQRTERTRNSTLVFVNSRNLEFHFEKRSRSCVKVVWRRRTFGSNDEVPIGIKKSHFESEEVFE